MLVHEDSQLILTFFFIKGMIHDAFDWCVSFEQSATLRKPHL
jgi:hypothetical protein